MLKGFFRMLATLILETFFIPSNLAQWLNYKILVNGKFIRDLLFRFDLFLILCVHMHVSMNADTKGSEKRVSDPLKLELQLWTTQWVC